MKRFNLYKYIIIPLLFTACSMSQETDFLRDFDPVNEDGTVNIVIEIPAGDNQKWEVDKESGALNWEVVGDSLRVISYLPYPANYGMVPRTFLPYESGGDNDPMDIFLLGPAKERGTVVPGRVIGVLKMLDRGEQDDKLIAVDLDSWFGGVYSIDDLESHFPGVIKILSVWMENYKGKDIVNIEGVLGPETAEALLEESIRSYQNIQVK